MQNIRDDRWFAFASKKSIKRIARIACHFRLDLVIDFQANWNGDGENPSHFAKFRLFSFETGANQKNHASSHVNNVSSFKQANCSNTILRWKLSLPKNLLTKSKNERVCSNFQMILGCAKQKSLARESENWIEKRFLVLFLSLCVHTCMEQLFEKEQKSVFCSIFNQLKCVNLFNFKSDLFLSLSSRENLHVDKWSNQSKWIWFEPFKSNIDLAMREQREDEQQNYTFHDHFQADNFGRTCGGKSNIPSTNRCIILPKDSSFQ